MKPINIFIIPFVLRAAGAGVIWQGTGEPYPFEALRGKTVTSAVTDDAVRRPVFHSAH